LQYFAYVDVVNLVARKSRKLEEPFQLLQKASEKAGFKINKIKTKYMINTRNKGRYKGTDTDTENQKIDNYTFQRVNVLVLIAENSEIKSEIKTRITAGNRCYHELIKLSTAVTQKTNQLYVGQ
jgi:ribosomal protein S4E